MDDVRTLLHDSGLNHSFWAEAAAYSIDTCNLIPSRRHLGRIPLEGFSGKRQDISHLRAFGAKCWAKIPTGLGGSKLDPRSVECRFLGYATGRGNYKVQDIVSQRVFVSRDIIFEEGQPDRTSASVGENIPVFDADIIPPADTGTDPIINVDNAQDNVSHQNPVDHDQSIPVVQRRPTRTIQPSQAILKSMEYKEREIADKSEGKDWANNNKHPKANVTIDGLADDHENVIACLNETKASHNIPRSYRHAMATDPDRWMML